MRPLATVAPLIAGAILLGGCHSAVSAPSRAPLEGRAADLAAFVSCLRADGLVVNRPSFTNEGELRRWLDLPPSTPPQIVAAAAERCDGKLPKIRPVQPELPPGWHAAAVRFVHCMRRHGVADMRAPTRDDLVLDDAGIDPNSETFRLAEAKCEHVWDSSGEGDDG